MTHYQTLGLQPTATLNEIKSAYRKLSLETHPDIHSGCSTKAEKFKRISLAYSVLGSEKERRLYDLRLKEDTFSFRGGNKAGASSAARGGQSFGYTLPRNVLIGSLFGISIGYIYNSLQPKQRNKESIGKKKLVEAYLNPKTGRYEKPRPWDSAYRSLNPEVVLVDREEVFDRK